MLGKLISAAAGSFIGRRMGGAQAGTMGTIAGAALPMVLRRFGPLGMIGAALGGYAVKRYADRRKPGTLPIDSQR